MLLLLFPLLWELPENLPLLPDLLLQLKFIPEIPTDGVHKLTKVVIITRQNKLEEFMQAMNEIGVTGITIYKRSWLWCPERGSCLLIVALR